MYEITLFFFLKPRFMHEITLFFLKSLVSCMKLP
jgi:hypothetical protein